MHDLAPSAAAPADAAPSSSVASIAAAGRAPGAATLQATAFIDADHPDVHAYAAAALAGLPADATPQARAVALYQRVRDGLRYTPWNVSVDKADYRASRIATRSFEVGGHCVDKALLLAACARAIGIPSRLHFANVRNHIGTEELERQLGTDLLVFHGYVELHLGGRWVAATPAFNSGLCARLGVQSLEFDGVHDSIFQAYDRAAGRFMEYVVDHGAFDDLPFEAMLAAWRHHYPRFAVADAWPRPAREAR